MDTTDIEKKSLEAHVELCAQRYKFLEERLESVTNLVNELKPMITDMHETIHRMAEKRNDQLIGWGLAVIAMLIGTVGWLLKTYVLQ
jgi:hypothetical protein